MKVSIFAAMTCATMFATNALANSEIVGTVQVVNVNKSWQGILVQLAGAPVFEPGSPCNSTYVYSPTSDELTKYILAVLTAAKSSGEQVRIGTNGCISTPMGSVPRIDWVDLGNRL
ncbi:hypothetical protein [Steroidobacter cummioxidans]|uniref:hypothetical protein n=1 Tax=Steroidobacter cummioxidans TaxID=1803913 RepID=UPI00129034E2|nr:hypothetical protein [Steroidobacter cummioxidans]